MRKFIFILLFIAGFIAEGCETGGCYYTCCVTEENCISSCGQSANSAEECTVDAQEECTEEYNGYIIRVEWTTVSEVFCGECNNSACAPNWWTAAQNMQYESDSVTSTDTRTETDSDSVEVDDGLIVEPMDTDVFSDEISANPDTSSEKGPLISNQDSETER